MIDEVKTSQSANIHNLTGNKASGHMDARAQQKQSIEGLDSSGSRSELSLTETAARLQQLEAQIASQPVVDSQRVDSIKQAIADGSFSVDANRVAEKMAQFENLLADKSGDN